MPSPHAPALRDFYFFFQCVQPRKTKIHRLITVLTNRLHTEHPPTSASSQHTFTHLSRLTGLEIMKYIGFDIKLLKH